MGKTLLFLLLTLQLASCQNHNNSNKNMNEQEYEWGVAVNTPIGYPIRFYAAMVGGMPIVGELYTKKEEPDWGNAYGYESHSMDKLPKSVDMVWLSYKEDCFYRLKTAIDYKKVEKLFKEGYKERFPNGKVVLSTYNTIVVGIAPGGVVVLWVGNGYKKITEIGRYQAEKIDLKEPPGLDSHERLIFDKEYSKKLLSSNSVIPEKVREANKNKPIPFGLWDSYRNHQYQWFPIYEIPDGKIGDVDYRYWNGEAGTTLYTDFNSYMGKVDFFYLEEPIQKRSLFKELVISYKAESGQKYLAEVSFDWEAVVVAYQKVFGKETNKVTAHLDIRVNRANTYLTFQLIGDNGKQTFLESKELKFYKLSDRNIITPTPLD